MSAEKQLLRRKHLQQRKNAISRSSPALRTSDEKPGRRGSGSLSFGARLWRGPPCAHPHVHASPPRDHSRTDGRDRRPLVCRQVQATLVALCAAYQGRLVNKPRHVRVRRLRVEARRSPASPPTLLAAARRTVGSCGARPGRHRARRARRDERGLLARSSLRRMGGSPLRYPVAATIHGKGSCARSLLQTRWRFYNAILAIPKADSDRFRICLSFLALNSLPQWIRESYLHRGFSDLEAMFELNSWIADLDLKKFFHQIPASWRTSQAQCVIVRCRRFMFTTAAMGPTLVPFVAQRISNYLSKLVAERCASITTRSLIDDHYWAARTFSACLAASRIVVEVYEYYGAVISIEKAHLYPSQVRAVLQNVIDTTSLRIYSPALRLKRLRNLTASLLATIEAGETVNPREIATIVGIVNSCRRSAWMSTFQVAGLRHLQADMVAAPRMVCVVCGGQIPLPPRP